ncbi:MAG: hypothetical protein CL694_03685 [Chloroflexi bacterium]|nr:hypothetical protein [Chloroflexota bacterium]MDP6800553.1 hypothetical protein [SAR202 cluster bacterium]HAL48864.1 hypothetical protein [Dehalococcoidia bacterium]
MSVGHASRVIEEAGIPTVCAYIRAFRHQTQRIKPARTLITKHMLGRTIGAPGDVARQTSVVKAALDMLETATEVGTIREFPETYPALVQFSMCR